MDKNRRKGDAKSASSSRAADVLRSQGFQVGFVGFGDATNIFHQDKEKLTVEIDAEIRATFGKLTKKDRRTREGAMDSLSKILQVKSEEEVKGSFSYYAGNYSTFVTDCSATIRSEANNVLKVYIKKLHKGIQEELKTILPLLLFSTYDGQNMVSKSANAVFTDCFDESKRTKIREAFAPQAVDIVLQIINRSHKLIQQQKFTDEENDEDRANRLIAQSFAVLHDLGETADTALLKELTSNSSTISHLLSLPESVRSSLFLLLTRLLKVDVDSFFSTKIPSAVLSSLDNRHVALSRNAFECFLIFAGTDRFYEAFKIEKAVIPKFVAMIRRKDRHWLVLETYLLPSFAVIYNHLPSHEKKSNWVKSVFESFFDGNILENAFPVSAWSNAFGELVQFCFVHSNAEADREVVFGKLFAYLDTIIDSSNDDALNSASSLLLWLHKKNLVTAQIKETFQLNMINKLPSSSSFLERFLPLLEEEDKAYQQEFIQCRDTPNLLLLKLLPYCENKSSFISAREFANRIEREENREIRLNLLSALIEFLEASNSEEVDSLDTLLHLENVSTSCEVIACLGKSERTWNSRGLSPELRWNLVKLVVEHILLHKEPSSIWVYWPAVVDAFRHLESEMKAELVESVLPIVQPKDVGRFSDLLKNDGDEELGALIGGNARCKIVELLVHQPIGTDIESTDVQNSVKALIGFRTKPDARSLKSTLRALFASDLGDDHIKFAAQVILKSGLIDDASVEGETFKGICGKVESYTEYFVSTELELLPYLIKFKRDSQKLVLREFVRWAYFEALIIQELPTRANEWSIAFIVICTALGAFMLEKKLVRQEVVHEIAPTIDELALLIGSKKNSWDRYFLENMHIKDFHCCHSMAVRFLVDNDKCLRTIQSVEKLRSALERDVNEKNFATFIALRAPITEEIVNQCHGLSEELKLAWRLESAASCGVDVIDINSIPKIVEDLGFSSFLFSYAEGENADSSTRNILTSAFMRLFSQIIWQFPHTSPELRDFVNCAVVTIFDVISSSSDEARSELMFDVYATLASRLYRVYILTARQHSELGESAEWVGICKEWQEFIFPTCNSSIISFFLHKSNIHLGSTVPYLADELSRTVRCMKDESFKELTLPKSLDPMLDQLRYPEELQNVLSPILRLICDSPSAPVSAQLAAVHMLSSLMSDMFEHENKEIYDSEKESKITSAKFKLPYTLKETLKTITSSSLEASDNIPPAILVWDALMNYALLLDVEHKFSFCRALESDNNKIAGELITIITMIYTRLPDIPRGAEMFTKKPTIERFDLNHYYCNLFYRTMNAIPAHVRDWAKSLSKSHFGIVSKFTQQYISPLLSRRELANINDAAKSEKKENLKVKVMPAINQITAEYKFEDSSMVLHIIIPPDYPLSLPSVNYEKKMLEAEKQRKWLLQLVAFLTHQNGSMWDGVNQWRRSIEDHMEGVEECLICFSTVSADNFQLPKIKCKPCRKKFHGSCLYKWFDSKDAPTCPHCRASFL